MDNVDKYGKVSIYKCSPVTKIVNKLLIFNFFLNITFIFPQLELKYLYINCSEWGDGIEF